ncbi:Ppx/GppA phosphatase family protein [Halomonas sp. M20]|uniref:Ppx/GppA phosphatase family protein n=1 Tax=Halomonas sp. M20 TaxID=2763264 RepID=UPI001D09B992|nr:Ppx/GppA phosphatase family protein [Halomonas sp. M20]
MRRTPQADAGQLRRLAAIDLGSNSFHLLVANYENDQLQVVAKLGEKVQLAAGIDDNGNLSEDAMQRALDCLTRFVTYIEDIASPDLRIVGTNALRVAYNSHVLIERAEALLGHEIEIIAGREEARLIYLGAAHALADVYGKRLIVDIGGGSTELIIGERFEPLALESLHMGCVTYTRRFFGEGNITEKHFRQAELAALSELANIRRPYLELGWSDPIGSSGTVKAIASILNASGDSPEGLIRVDGLRALRDRVIKQKRLDKVAMEGLKEDRARVFPAGLAILCAIFEAFDLTYMRYSDGALRDGVLYDVVGRNTPEDSRLKTLYGLQRRYSVDTRQAANVASSAATAFDQVREAWQLGDVQHQFLTWGAWLHELGLAVSHSKFHRHGAYLIENSDLPGFSRPEQRALAFLALAHRRKFPHKELATQPASIRLRYARLSRLLRLAVIFNHSRPEQPIRDFTLHVEGEALHLSLSEELAERTLLLDDLRQERRYQKAAGFVLEVSQLAEAV